MDHHGAYPQDQSVDEGAMFAALDVALDRVAAEPPPAPRAGDLTQVDNRPPVDPPASRADLLKPMVEAPPRGHEIVRQPPATAAPPDERTILGTTAGDVVPGELQCVPQSRGNVLFREMRPTMSTDVSDTILTFRTRLFGFDKDEVRDGLRNLASLYDEARKQIERLTAASRASEGAVHPVSHETIAVQVERVLVSAHRVAEEVRVEAENAAKRTLREAQEEAAQLRGQAATDAAALASTGAARRKELEAEIDRMTELGHEVQGLLDRAADRLNEIAHSMRQPSLQESLALRKLEFEATV
jgi:cell division septum initiation protein DivIVA